MRDRVKLGYACLFGAVLQVVAGLLVSVDDHLAHRGSAFFRDSAPLFVLIALLELAAIIGLRLSGVAGAGRLVAVGFGLAVVGRVLHIVGEVVDRYSAAGGKAVLGSAEPLTALGMIIVGVGVLRTGQMAGLWRFSPLVLGGYIFLVLLPAFAASGGPNFAAVAGWGLCWAFLGGALVTDQAWRKTAVA